MLFEILPARNRLSMSEKMPAPATAHLSHKSKPDWVRRVVWGGIASLLFFIVILSLPVVLRPGHRGSSDRAEAVHNARQIGVVLFEFEKTYGAFPSDETAELVTKARPDHGFDLSAKSSNALFLQLIAANLTQNETMFYAEVKNSEKRMALLFPAKPSKNPKLALPIFLASLRQSIQILLSSSPR